ncbi:MAG: enoyl-CoA hydratase [Oceanospirillaceae bacterium]|mgnify:CR=1 FL=1|nr:enoyl-CoA hydratase [Oceanospirillaceae bacterium]MBT11946.1 enoyl-CoA hydratase [Oceanospirillaceae bacterium]|tara:strand:- start:34298 stop:35053 length:756 start_codon:yes stop_codon:yes gene_type:complete
MYQDITYNVEDGIAVITINRPKVLNAIRIQTYDDIIDALYSSDKNDDVSVVVMTGAEGRFTAGNDLSDLLPPSDISELKKRVGGIFDAFAQLSKPLIIAQEGVAIGIGANMLLHADIAYAGKSIRYSLPFAKIGVTSEGACSVLLAEAIGPKRANELLYTGRFFTAEEAENWGLLTAMTEDGKALETAMATARDLLKNSQGSIRSIKKLGKAEGHEARVHKAVEEEMRLFAELLDTPETQARINHVLKGGK